MSWTVSVTSEPTIEPVDVDYVKRQAAIYIADDNTLLEGYIKLGRQVIEDKLGRALITHSFQLVLDWCFSGTQIKLPRSPLISVESVNYVDESGVEQVLDPSVYGTNLRGEPGSIFLQQGQSWPTTNWQPGAVWIEFTAGYGDTVADVSMAAEQIRYWIAVAAAEAYDLREASVISNLPTSQLNGFKVPIMNIST